MQTTEIYSLKADIRDLWFRCRQQRFMVQMQTAEIYSLDADSRDLWFKDRHTSEIDDQIN